MKKILFMMILFILSVNSFADEYDDYASSQEQKNGKSKKSSSLQIGVGVNILTETNYEWRATVQLEQNIALYLISNFNRNAQGNNDANYNFSLGAGASFQLPTNPLPMYAGASIKYIHPATDNNGAAINAFVGLKALFLNAFEVAGELGIYFEQIYVGRQTNSNIGLRPAVYLSWFFI